MTLRTLNGGLASKTMVLPDIFQRSTPAVRVAAMLGQNGTFLRADDDVGLR